VRAAADGANALLGSLVILIQSVKHEDPVVFTNSSLIFAAIMAKTESRAENLTK